MKVRTRLKDAIDPSSTETSLLVVSDSHVGRMLASDIDTIGTHLVTNSDRVAARTPDSVPTTVGDVTAAETLTDGIDADIAVIALQRDRETLLVAQLLRTQLEIDTIVILLNNPDRREAFDNIATNIVCVSASLSAELRDAIGQTSQEPSLQS